MKIIFHFPADKKPFKLVETDKDKIVASFKTLGEIQAKFPNARIDDYRKENDANSS